MKKNIFSVVIVFMLLYISILTSVTAIPLNDLPYTELGEYAITPDGKHAYINNDTVFIMAPGEIHGSGWTYVNFTSKQFTGDIDLALGFDTTHLKPKRAEFYKPHYENYTMDYTIYNVTSINNWNNELLDMGNEYNLIKRVVEYSQANYNYSGCDPMFENCIPDNYTTETLVVAFDSYTNEGNNYTITYHNKRIENWIDITHKFSVLPESIHNNYNDKNKWYYVKDQPVTAGAEYQIRIDVSAPPQLGKHVYKYDVVIKPSSQDFATANSNGNLFILDPYWNTSWNRRFFVTYNQSAVGGPQNSIPVQYYFTGITGLNADGSDIRITYENGTQAPREIETVDSTTGNGSIFLLANLSDTGFWFYYNNSVVTEPATDSTYGSEAVWNANYVFVSHMVDLTSTTILDSTSFSKTYTKLSSGNPIEYNTLYGKSQDFSDDYISTDNSANFDFTDFTFESYYYKDTDVTGAIMSKFYDGSARSWEFDDSTVNDYTDAYVNAAGTPHVNSAVDSVTIQNWYYTALLHDDSSTSQWYIDGSASGSAVDIGAVNFNNASVKIGDRVHATSRVYFDGKIAELRLSNILRSSDYISTTSNNLHNPSVIGIAPFYNSTGDVQYYTNSLHYNATSPYNHTIESDGTITSNRSIIAGDDTNDTTLSTGTSYLILNVYDNAASIIRNFTFTGDDLDWYQAANLSGTYDLKNSSGIIETQSDGNFTTNLTAGTYWIEKVGVSISLLSFTPSPLYTNYTGATVISYMVESTNPLNLSSLAFLYGLNYTTTGDMHNYIATPPIDIASEGIYLAPNRNITPYLSWEFNDTITEGNVWQWGGGDNNSWWIEKNPVNATHTYINATGVTQHILPSSFYIQKLAMYNAPKTGFEINRQQGLIFKMWNVEEIRNRDANYFANLYFDTSWESTLPNYPVEVGFCNFSYDPTVDDIDTSPDCTKFGEWSGDRWINHSWVPGPNASYALPFVVNASQFTEPTPTDINYIWLRSNTISSKSFILNATNYDPGITNISFAETETMWTYNELNGVTTPVAYTPSFFTTFVRDYEELLHHLYIADDMGAWGHSEIFNEVIGLSSVPVSPVSFEYFNVTCDESYHDEEMDATYDQGAIGVGLHCPADPDGGIVSHNLTLHYYPNQTLVAVINNTFTTTGGEYVEIAVNTTPYYSSDTLYTFRCVSTDDENDVATKWLISYFALDADGNRGWVIDDQLLFWGMNDIPTLYAEVSNSSLISYNGGTDIYTMHVPFFKSKGNDTFYFNETVHLESLNNEDVSFFRFLGRVYFDYANIYAWNTTTDTPAPITDTYRSYVYSLTMTCGNITNSNFSYLGSDFYRQEGLNFVGNSYEYLIYNSTFSHNAEGPIMEYCSNMNISLCTITDNVNTGIGVYFTNDTIVLHNTIDSNGGRGVAMYGAHNSIISYNDITNSGIHGIHYWSNSMNNTCTGNDISGSALYDYYLSSSSTGNYIIDPASTTDRIRVTSTSNVNIENTDNVAFTEDSLNTSYAYLTNFSMFVSGASQTFDITSRDMTILPSTDKVAIWNLEWDTSVEFNATSDTDINPTWFNISQSAWTNTSVHIYRNDELYTNQTANATGVLLYNYSESMTGKWFEFRTTLISVIAPILLQFYILMVVFALLMTGYTFLVNDINNYTNIITGFISGIIYFIAGYYAYIGIGVNKIHETALFTEGVVTSTVTTAIVTSYQYDWIGLLFIIMGVVLFLYSIVQSINAVQYTIVYMEDSK